MGKLLIGVLLKTLLEEVTEFVTSDEFKALVRDLLKELIGKALQKNKDVLPESTT